MAAIDRGKADGAGEAPKVGAATTSSPLRLPDEFRRHTFRHVMTGERLPPLVAADAAWLTAAHVFGSFPVGLLVTERS